MNDYADPKAHKRLIEARESFSGRLLTDAQFEEAIAITAIIEREIQKTGAFKEKLGDYAYAFARTESFDAVKAETILRDLFKARTGQSMNQMREDFAAREEKLPASTRPLAYEYAAAVGPMIEEGTRITFNRAFAHQAQQLAGELGITDVGARRLMKEEFKAAEARELQDWGKELEEKFYRPQIEADMKKDKPEADSERTRSSRGYGAHRRTPSRSGPRP
ncbi:hypothetical protein [Xanthobacter autotrophicus]|uniref:hypothetical protein n=1 Tax=Xanthobacter autotrophicus TaxID=280 RepID=UPI00372B345C